MENELWPSGCLPITATEPSDSRAELALEIEAEFARRWKTEVVLVPSGRAALSLGLKLLGIDRSDLVYAPRWSSHCVWNVITRYANPMAIDPHACDVILAVHQHGHAKSFDRPPSAIVIEDSCDSLVLSAESLFPNEGRFEIFSLPKIMGTYTGGILVSKDSDMIAGARRLVGEYSALNAHQGELRYRKATNRSAPFDDWDALEYRNFSLDPRSLAHIRDSLDQIDRNAETIRSRIEYLAERHPKLLAKANPIGEGRLPPVMAIPTGELTDRVRKEFLVRHVDRGDFVEDPKFLPHLLVPLHFGISEDRFTSLAKIASDHFEDKR